MTRLLKGLRAGIASATLALLVACGGSYSPSAPSPTPGGGGGGGGTPTITITAAGVNPREITVRIGSRVMFTNNNTRAHDMSSDPHPEHTDCPEINQAGFIQPGQTRETGNFTTARTCGFHDHNQPETESLQGRIIVTP